MTEEWRPVVDVPGFEVSDQGHVRRSVPLTGRRGGRALVGPYLAPIATRHGPRVRLLLVEERRSVQRAIRRLVAEAFLGLVPGDRLHDVVGQNGDLQEIRAAHLEIVRRGDRSAAWHAAKGHRPAGAPTPPRSAAAPRQRSAPTARRLKAPEAASIVAVAASIRPSERKPRDIRPRRPRRTPPCPGNPLGGHYLVQPPGARPWDAFTCRVCGYMQQPAQPDYRGQAWRRKEGA